MTAAERTGIATVAREMRAERIARAETAIREGKATRAQAEADASLWAAIAHYFEHGTGDGAEYLARDGNWDRAAKSAARAMAKAEADYLIAGGDASPSARDLGARLTRAARLAAACAIHASFCGRPPNLKPKT